MRLRSNSSGSFPERFLLKKQQEDIGRFAVVCLLESCDFCSRRIVKDRLVGFGDDSTVWSLADSQSESVIRYARSHEISGYDGIAAHMLLSSVAFQADYARAGRSLGISRETLRTLGYPIIECQEAVCVHNGDDYLPGMIMKRACISLRKWILDTLDEAGIVTVLWQIALFLLVLGNAFGYAHGDLHPGNVVLERRLTKSHSFTFGAHRYRLPKGTWLPRFVDMDTSRFKLRDGTIINLGKDQYCPADLYMLCSRISNIRGVDELSSLTWMKNRKFESFSARAILRRLGKSLREV